MPSDEERLAVRASCSRWLSGHREQSMTSRLTQLAAMTEADDRPDIYGKGSAVQALERRVADLLGKPAARFVIKGVIAQQAALRAWADQRGIATVALHPLKNRSQLLRAGPTSRASSSSPVSLAMPCNIC